MKKTQEIVLIAMFAAIISIISPISIGIYIMGVPTTMQTFVIAFVGYLLGCNYAVKSTIIYILLGCIGLPVFGGFKGGVGVLLSVTGGYIIGFIALAALTGVTVEMKSKLKIIVVSFIGLMLCHIIGVCWFAVTSGTDIMTAIFTVMLPYLPKDILSVAAAYIVAKQAGKVMKTIKI